MENTPSRVTILGVGIDKVTTDDAALLARRFLASPGQYHITTVNPEFLMEARHHQFFRTVLQKADLSLPDGFGLLAAARFKGTPLSGRVTGADFTLRLAELAQELGARIFLFGAEDGVARLAAHALQRHVPGLKIVGAENEWSFLRHKRSNQEILARIRRRRPSILLVALGSPQQELWIAEHLSLLPSVRIAMGVGGTFDFYAGRVRRAPLAFRRLGLEWLWRLTLEPRRWHRIVTAVIRFPLAVLRDKP